MNSSFLVDFAFQIGTGKRQTALNPAAKKENNRHKSTVTVSKSNKPKRTFGAVLSSNIPVERALQKPTTVKPWKPSGVSRNIHKQMNKFSSVSSGTQGGKSANDEKTKYLTSQGRGSPAAISMPNEISQNDLVCTPISLTKPLVQETPFLSAEDCSKCRLDKLETSSYWLAQIRLAESTGKHFVSAAFFRLSLECKAKPFVALRKELQRYQFRHGVELSEKLWPDLCRDFGLPSGQVHLDSGDVVSIDGVLAEKDHCNCNIVEVVDFNDGKHLCMDYDIVDKPEEILDDIDAAKDVSEEIHIVNNSEDGILDLISSQNCQDDEKSSSSSILNEGVNDPLKIEWNMSNFGHLSLNDSASETKSSKHNISDRPCGQAGIICGRNPAGRKESGAATIRLRDLLKSKRKSKEQSSADVVNRDEAEGIQIVLQDTEPKLCDMGKMTYFNTDNSF